MMFDVKQFGKDKVHTVGMLLTKSSFLGRKFERKSFRKEDVLECGNMSGDEK